MNPVEHIFELFQKSGADLYLGEDVTQLQHALQAAHLAARDGAPDSLVAAALLHDLGHLMNGAEEGTVAVDLRHEDIGGAWLAKHFPEAVWMPVRLHVAAKRYLCATHSSYGKRLSPGSIHSLGLQGGPMSAEEVEEFERSPFCKSAVRLRLWDEDAKDPALEVAGLDRYGGILRGLVR